MGHGGEEVANRFDVLPKNKYALGWKRNPKESLGLWHLGEFLESSDVNILGYSF